MKAGERLQGCQTTSGTLQILKHANSLSTCMLPTHPLRHAPAAAAATQGPHPSQRVAAAAAWMRRGRWGPWRELGAVPAPPAVRAVLRARAAALLAAAVPCRPASCLRGRGRRAGAVLLRREGPALLLLGWWQRRQALLWPAKQLAQQPRWVPRLRPGPALAARQRRAPPAGQAKRGRGSQAVMRPRAARRGRGSSAAGAAWPASVA